MNMIRQTPSRSWKQKIKVILKTLILLLEDFVNYCTEDVGDACNSLQLLIAILMSSRYRTRSSAVQIKQRWCDITVTIFLSDNIRAKMI